MQTRKPIERYPKRDSRISVDRKLFLGNTKTDSSIIVPRFIDIRNTNDRETQNRNAIIT